MTDALRSICEENKLNLFDTQRLTGGDINEVYLIRTQKGRFVLKLNNARQFPEMFEAEAKGLEQLRSSQSFRIPEVIKVGTNNKFSYLLMEYLPEGRTSNAFWKDFAQRLAKLHSLSHEYFGLDHDNYIGSLRQFNTKTKDVFTFYIEQRLEPQFKWAHDSGYSYSLENFYRNLKSEIPNEPPALIHGDLWNGNFMVDESNSPVLIDPAVAFAPREMDLAMMQLFGGFPQVVYEIYDNQLALEKGWQERSGIWQLYYLLVHLNLFGSGYYSQVKSIVDQYS